MSAPVIVVSQPVHRESLKCPSPLVIQGWFHIKTKQIVAWLKKMGDTSDPWALVLKINDESLPHFEKDYLSLKKHWTVFINEDPPADMPRVYVFEDVGCFSEPPQVEHLLRLAESFPVIVVTDTEGILPGYLEATHPMTRSLLYNPTPHTSALAWAQVDLSVPLANVSPRFGHCD